MANLEREKAIRRIQGRDCDERGFTLIEISIAMLVLTIGLVSIVGVSGYVSRANSTSNTLSVLATVAQSRADSLRSQRWTVRSEQAAITVGGSLTSDVTDHFATETNTPAGDVAVRWQVRASPAGNTRYVTIRVTQVNAPPHMRDGLTISTMINRN